MTTKACLAIAMFVILAATFASQNAPPPATGTVQGIVTREGTNDPVPDVEIQIPVRGPVSMSVEQARSLTEYVGAGNTIPQDALYQARNTLANAAQGVMPPKPTPPLRAITDASGRFSIPNVPAGETHVIAQLAGYFGPASDGNSPQVSIRHLIVAPQKTESVQLTLIPGGTISGRVTDANGKPQADAMVRLLRQTYVFGHTDYEPMPGGKSTDDRGEFRLYRVPPGEYLLAVQARSARPVSLSNDMSNGTNAVQIPILTLYPGVTDPARAVQLIVKGGDELTGISVQALMAPGARISGKVTSTLPPAVLTGARGAVRAPVATVSIMPHDAIPGSNGQYYPPVTASPEGNFEIPNIPPGTYDLIARLPAAYGWGSQNPPERATGAWAFGRNTVEVRGANVENIAIVVNGGIDVPGRVMVDGRPASPALSLTLIPDDSARLSFDEPAVNTFNQIAQYKVKIDPDGSFKFPALPEGRYRIQAALLASASLSKSAYLADVRQGNLSVYDNGLTVTTREANPLVVFINTNGGILNGSVLGQDRSPAGTDATAVLVPSDNRRQNPEMYFVARATADNHGGFALSSIPPGSYKLFAWANVKPGAYKNAEFLRQFENRGVPVTVLANAVVSAEVEFIP